MSAPVTPGLTLRGEIIAALKAAPELAGVRTIEAMPGDFNDEELRRYSTRCPAVLLAVPGATGVVYTGGNVTETLQFAAFVVATGQHRDDVASAISERLGAIVAGNRWDNVSAGRPKNVRRDNLYAPALGRKTTAMWVVAWTQSYDLRTPDADELEDFRLAIADYEVHEANDDGTNDPADTAVTQTRTELPQ